MNQEIILKKIEENKLESITESELIWILKNDNIRKILIEKLENTKYFPKIWDSFKTKEIQNLLNNKKDFLDIINYCYFCEEEKNNLELYCKDLINMYKSIEEYYPHLPKTNEKLKKDQQKYLENMKERLIKDTQSNPFTIVNTCQIQFIIDNNIEKIYQKIDINYLTNLNVDKEKFEIVLKKIEENLEFFSSFISNKKTFMYIIDNHINIPTFFIINDSKMNFTKEEIPKVIEYNKKNKIEINNKDLIMYAVNNNIYDLKIKIEDDIPFTDEEIPKILAYLDTSKILSNISNQDIVKYCIKNEKKELSNILSVDTIDGLNYTAEDLPKVIEILKSITNRFNFEKLEKNKLLINYIIQNEIFDLINLISIEEQELNIDLLKKLIIYNDKEKKDNHYFNYLSKRDPGEIAKFLELLKVRTLSNKDISSINESFQQQIYRQNNKEVVEIFNMIKELSERKDLSQNQKYSYYLTYLNKFMKTDCIPEIIDKEMKEKNTSVPYIEKKKLFLEEILLNVMIENNYQPYLDILHEVTNKYISQKANQYFIEHDIYSLPNIQINYDTIDNLREVKRKVFNYLNKKKPKYLLCILQDNGYKYDKIEGNNFKEARNIFLDWYDKVRAEDDNNSILPLELQFLLKDKEFTQNLKKEIIYEKRTLKIKDMLNNFTVDDLEIIFNTIINDNKKYQKLLELISKYKVLEWPYIFNEIIKIITNEEYENMFDFIKNFNAIYEKNNIIYQKEEIKSQEYKKICEKLQEKYQNTNLPNLRKEVLIKEMDLKQIEGNFKITPYQLLLDHNNLISINEAYKTILGTEDYTFIKENPSPNATMRENGESLSKFNQKRIEKSIEQYLTMLDITHNSIPSFITTISLSSGKEIKVTVGNRTSTRNLSLGERTGSCMRIGGAGEKLYEFCNSDPRGIHIVFEDPKTNEFISRVSGYRNGNTLFLNQLRESISKDYEDADLIETCKIVSEMILQISNSKEKELPIENVIADSGYALINEERIQAPFSKLEVQLPGYSDVGNSGIVILATKNKNNTLTPLRLNPYIKPIYETARIKPTMYQEPNKTSKEKIKRIKFIALCNQHSNNKEFYKELQDNDENIDFIYAIISDDWYILLTKDYKIEIINASCDERALEEIKAAKEILNEQIKWEVKETNEQKKR